MFDSINDGSGVGKGSVVIKGCAKGITEFVIPTTVTTKGGVTFKVDTSEFYTKSEAFKGNTTIEKVAIPDGILWIGKNTFQDCTGLTEMSVGVLSDYSNFYSGFGENAFKGCTNLKTYNIDSTGMDAAYTSDPGTLESLKNQIKNAGIGVDADGNMIAGVTVRTQENSIVWQAITELNQGRADAPIYLAHSDNPYARNTIKGHTWDAGTVKKAATCSSKGIKTYRCTDDGCTATKTVDIPINPNAHAYKTAWSKDATYHWHGCKYNNNHIAKKAKHTWDSGEITKKPSATATGVKTYTCTVCQATRTETIVQTAVSKGATAKKAETAIVKIKNDKDPKGTSFRLLQMRVKGTTKTSITLQWAGAKGAKKFVVYGNNCNKGKKVYKYKKLKTLTKKSLKLTKINKTKIKSGTFYKFMVVALDKNGKVIATSKTVHICTKGKNAWNIKSVTVPKKVITNAKKLKKGKTLKVNAKAIKDKKNKAKMHRAICYESSNPAIATVSAKGVITGKKKGTCYVYAYAQNGMFKKITVTVK